MEVLIIKFILTYFAIGTFVLLNLLFNTNIHLYMQNKETGEIIYPSSLMLCGIAYYWIFMLPFLLIISKRSKDDE